ncbi:MAG: Fe-S protein assembly co-chaperone HscB [Candidatus Zixiibacteriota bacterium]
MSHTPNDSLHILNDGHHLCWSCKEEVGEGPFCSHCVKIQPLEEVSDYFALFGLEPHYKIDPADLQKPFIELSRKMHPDFYGQLSDSEQVIARDNTAYLNMAYGVLKDPIKRADYLLSLKAGNTKSNPTPPQDLFDEILETGELLMNDILSADEIKQLNRTKNDFTVRQRELLDSLAPHFDKLLNGHNSAKTEVESRLNNVKYLRTIIRRIEQRLKQDEN